MTGNRPMPDPSSTITRRGTYEVDPARLAHGTWCHESQQQVGEGDIAAAYSADLIAMEGRVRCPFTFRGGVWTCAGCFTDDSAFVYRIVPIEASDCTPTSYAAKTRNAEVARNDPNGFYHGITVRHGCRSYVITGPPVELVPGQVVQASLFDAA